MHIHTHDLHGPSLDLAAGLVLEGSTLRRGDVTDPDSLERDGVRDEPFDAFVSCLASRSGTESDAWAVDDQTNLNVLRAAERSGTGHFVLLSAIGELLFELTGRRPKIRRLPLHLFDAVTTPIRLAAVVAPRLNEKAELARIGRYYATEPMLLRDPWRASLTLCEAHHRAVG